MKRSACARKRQHSSRLLTRLRVNGQKRNNAFAERLKHYVRWRKRSAVEFKRPKAVAKLKKKLAGLFTKKSTSGRKLPVVAPKRSDSVSKVKPACVPRKKS